MQVTKEEKYDGCRCNIAPAMIVLVFNKAYFERVDGRKRRIRGETGEHWGISENLEPRIYER